MKKSDREIVRMKYQNKCAYCGCELQKGWHVDEIQPCVRIFKILPAYSTPNKYIPARRVWTGKYEHPERLNIDNQIPACASCNINKHSMSLEDFRNSIAGFMKHLNEVNTQYKIAKRYKLVIETNEKVVFYFESLKSE